MADLTGFQLSNAKLQNGTFTATVSYQITFGNFDTISNTRLRVFWYDNIANSFTDYNISNNIGTMSISKSTTGPYVTVSGQCLALPSTLSGNVLSGGTFYPVVMAPSPPAISTATLSGDPNNNFKITFITDGSTTQISLNIKKPNDSTFSQWLPPTNTPPNGMVPIQLPISGQYGTYSFQGFAINSGGTSPGSNISTITVNFSLATYEGKAIKSASDPTVWFIKNLQKDYITTNQEYVALGSPTINIVDPSIIALYPQGPNLVFTQSTALTVKAVDGTQQTFYLSSADASAVSVSPPGAIISSVASSNPISNTLQDVANFFQAHNVSTTPPPQPTPAPTGFSATSDGPGTGTIRLSWVSQYPVTLTMNGQLRAQGLSNTNYSLFNQPAGTYTFTLLATNNGVNSTPVQTSIMITDLVVNNYSYNIQIPNVSNALQLITAVNYGTGASISFPARQFVKNILNQDVASIPNTLNALFIAQVATTPNEIQVANALISYFPVTPPPPTGPKRSIIEIAGGIFAGLLTLSLFTSGSSKKGKR